MSYERYADFTQVNGATVNAAYDEIASLKQQLAEAQAKLAAVERELAEAKKTLEWLYRWIGHKPLSECVRKVSDTLQAMRQGASFKEQLK